MNTFSESRDATTEDESRIGNDRSEDRPCGAAQTTPRNDVNETDFWMVFYIDFDPPDETVRSYLVQKSDYWRFTLEHDRVGVVADSFYTDVTTADERQPTKRFFVIQGCARDRKYIEEMIRAEFREYEFAYRDDEQAVWPMAVWFDSEGRKQKFEHPDWTFEFEEDIDQLIANGERNIVEPHEPRKKVNPERFEISFVQFGNGDPVDVRQKCEHWADYLEFHLHCGNGGGEITETRTEIKETGEGHGPAFVIEGKVEDEGAMSDLMREIFHRYMYENETDNLPTPPVPEFRFYDADGRWCFA